MAGLSYIEIRGTPFDAGRALGEFGAAALHDYARRSAVWARAMRLRSSALAASMAHQVRTRFPRVWEELQGMAVGIGLPFDDLFLWNCRGDLWAMAPDGCTTVQQAGEVRRITHNEDGDPAFAGHCAIAACAVAGAVPFAAFVYPGSIAGHTFAVTDGGLAMTVNSLRCRAVQPGVPRMVLARALLEVAGLDEALTLVRGTERAGSFHLTLAHRNEHALLSVEFSAQACAVETVCTSRRALHTNHALHLPLRALPQTITPSSRYRQQRGTALLAGDSGLDALQVLADTGDARFPILRTASLNSGAESTLATADIRIHTGCIEWQVYEHPARPPCFHMRGARAAHRGLGLA
ncbi:peptidase C45 [Verminephrobacter aporrectodeae subsp. tuberculatae]|uniref:C45 family autoproteolytic acyltransferase/hydolase n=1 Tax=Verminephrobacter aporrectodeae TaxID=1110389 RepID=UPI002243390E|nr:C45 family peptidase [Verminephrobacter aporrectodeae]MCW8166276.1 peptidase C45 [Verminephrobacter aporrectodeae subsp. tuberculatae]MCW8170314.1 peptidase C45 [Verminephrobacter aporrectodeae subsp. tuberculatae]